MRQMHGQKMLAGKIVRQFFSGFSTGLKRLQLGFS